MVIGRNSVSASPSSSRSSLKPSRLGVELGPELLLGLGVVLALEQLLGVVAPRPEVVLVEDDQVPVRLVQPGVLGLDVAGLVLAEQVLERPEVDQRPLLVGRRRVAAVRLGQVLPAVEVGVGLQVVLPRRPRPPA